MAVHGLGNSALQTLLGVIVWTICVYSFAGHKEWRFIHPLVPLFHILASKSLVDRSSTVLKNTGKLRTLRLPIRKAFLGLLLVTVPVSGWIVLIHCSAPLSVMSFIRNIPENELQGGVVGILMPCHSTPGHAYLHRPKLANGGLWALGCEPPLEYSYHLKQIHWLTQVVFLATKILAPTNIKQPSSLPIPTST